MSKKVRNERIVFDTAFLNGFVIANRLQSHEVAFMKYKKLIVLGYLTFMFLFNFVFYSGVVMAIENLDYDVESKSKFYEIRAYKPFVVAEVLINKNFKESSASGFRLIFDYIQGNNVDNNKIPMTVPVIQQKSDKMDLKNDPLIQSSPLGGYKVQFKLPQSLKFENAPQPKDKRVQILQIPNRKMAVYTYTGSWSESKYKKMLKEFKSELSKDKVTTSGEPYFARYNSPFRIWIFRTNEIWLEVKN